MGRRSTHTTGAELVPPEQMPAKIEPRLTKEDVLKMMKAENLPIPGKNKYSQFFVVLELKRLRDNLGIIKGELIEGDQIELRGSVMLPLTETDQPSQWKHIGVGESEFIAFSFDTREASFMENARDFLKRSLEEGKIQDIIGLIK